MENLIDVSYAQGEIQHAEVIKNVPKVTGVMIKASEGIGVTDKMLKKNAVEFAKLGVPIGYYHFAVMHSVDPTTKQKTTPEQDAKREALCFLAAISGLPKPELGLVLDLETNKVGNLGPFEVEKWAQTFFDTLANTGLTDLKIYGGVPFLNTSLPNKHKLGKYPLWLARYTNEVKPLLPIGWTEYWNWQYTSTGKIKGIAGFVDLSRK